MPDIDSTPNVSSWPREEEDKIPPLPPFYSPRPIPVSRAISELDLNSLNLNNRSIPSRVPFPDANSESEPEPDAPLPDLVSPAFTPPSTPGTSTPSHRSAAQHIPKSVPVDSTVVNGGCGQKKPKLLDKLPDVNCVVRARIPTTIGGMEMFLHLYQNSEDNKEHLAIVFGNGIRSRTLDKPREGETEMDRLIRGAYTGRLYPGRTASRIPEKGIPAANGKPEVDEVEKKKDPPLVRIHSECYTGETVWSARCDCGEQLDEAARLMSLPGSEGGIIIYLRQEGRGIGLGEKLKAYNLQDLGSDTVEANLLLRHPADARSYGLATAMLADLGQTDIRLLTNNPDKVRAVEGPNREIVVKERVAMIPLAWKGKGGGIRSQEVGGYLKTKIEKMGHMLQMGEQS
ncbi:putative GTP cyclohydrolase-2 [Lachnellula hyalina]|uniref:GTP cyclohydrolase II n=1 Tax=Lachnellula hyalina TaxID=1316788 RepID=A0A8H8R756_9HELO|nr:putative GTP cyclohydrolase-2 [Lachnellula hyalina]TVY29715.1 putative GTP cyclohydrolase-2 [Lachnellula hyalina]